MFVRVGWQDEAAAVEYDAIYSGGIDLAGRLWGRERDNLGIGLAYLSGGNNGLEESRVGEVYYRLAINGVLAITGDVQYLEDNWRNDKGPSGYVFGARATVEF